MSLLGVDSGSAASSRSQWLYESVRIETGFRVDLIIEHKVIVKIESVELLAPVPKKAALDIPQADCVVPHPRSCRFEVEDLASRT
jgi:hypothetical protein